MLKVADTPSKEIVSFLPSKIHTRKGWLLLLVVISLLALVARLLIAPGFVETRESILYVRGVMRYSLLDFRPYWPGYPVYMWAGKVLVFFTSDAVSALTDGSGAVTGLYAFSAGGLDAATGNSGVIGGGGKIANDHLFAGEQLDPTGLYYDRARYYNPAIGRFTQSDSFEGFEQDPLSLNHFAYSEGNPMLKTDPTGNSVYMTIEEAKKLKDWNLLLMI